MFSNNSSQKSFNCMNFFSKSGLSPNFTMEVIIHNEFRGSGFVGPIFGVYCCPL